MPMWPSEAIFPPQQRSSTRITQNGSKLWRCEKRTDANNIWFIFQLFLQQLPRGQNDVKQCSDHYCYQMSEGWMLDADNRINRFYQAVLGQHIGNSWSSSVTHSGTVLWVMLKYFSKLVAPLELPLGNWGQLVCVISPHTLLGLTSQPAIFLLLTKPPSTAPLFPIQSFDRLRRPGLLRTDVRY